MVLARPGAHGARDALAYGVKVTGSTIHLVDEERHVALPFLRQQVKKSRDRANMCLADFISPNGDWMGGFAVGIHDNPAEGFGPILTAERIEDPSRPTVLLYGHGDTVHGLDEQWSEGLKPWTLTERDGRWYGRGTVDNKGQHALNLSALEAVLAGLPDAA